MMWQTIKAFVDTNKQIQLLEPVKFAKKQALVIILNDNETTTAIADALKEKLQRPEQSRLAQECAKLNPNEEKALAE